MTNIELVKLHTISVSLAERLKIINDSMEGKGISPVRSLLVQDELKSIENALRKLGGNPTNPIPF